METFVQAFVVYLLWYFCAKCDASVARQKLLVTIYICSGLRNRTAVCPGFKITPKVHKTDTKRADTEPFRRDEHLLSTHAGYRAKSCPWQNSALKLQQT